MKTYLALLRGVNVGGRNKVQMAALRAGLQERGFSNVTTFIASGNVILESDRCPATVKDEIERALTEGFRLDSRQIKVLVLTPEQLAAVVRQRPKGFGDEPAKYHSDAIFLIDIDAAEVMPVFDPREGVDTVWPGEGVIYSQRLSAQRTKSRLNRAISTPAYASMTIRSWQTTTRLLDLLRERVGRAASSS
jgi:uncharacterized protein (DUF1697 family)